MNTERTLFTITKFMKNPLTNLFIILAASLSFSSCNMLSDDELALQVAARSGDITTARQLIAKGTDVNATSSFVSFAEQSFANKAGKQGAADLTRRTGANALGIAAYHGQSAVFSLLLNSNSDIQHLNNEGQNVLALAILGGKIDIVESLLQKGASTKHRDNEGRTAMHFAAANNNSLIIQTLLRYGAYVDPGDNTRLTPLHYCADLKIVEAAEYLISRGANVNRTDNKGKTPLIYAAMRNVPQLINILIQAGANINHRDADDYHALDRSIREKAVDASIALIRAGADYSSPDRVLGLTPLHLAAQYGNAQMVNILLSLGVNGYTLTKDGFNALDIAKQNFNTDCYNLLYQRGVRESAKQQRNDRIGTSSGGSSSGSGTTECSSCRGKAVYHYSDGTFHACPACSGTGYKNY